VVAVLVWQAAAYSGAVPDPTEPGAHLSHGAVVVDSGLLVFREGLEMILVLAAVTASFRGGNSGLRRPVAAGGAAALGATVLTWYIAIWAIGALGGPGLDVQAATGLLAVAVLLLVMNWFFHRVYWTGWIAHHHDRRRSLLGRADAGDGRTALLLGLALLGFTSVYREGFEVVLFLQNMRIEYGSETVLQGVGVGLALTAAVGVVTFALQQRLPYKRMLIVTGVLLGVVLMVMVGESIQEMQLAGWIPSTSIGFGLPDWMGLWFAVFPTVEGIVAQVLALVLVAGSYLLAEHVRVRRPRRRGERVANRPEAPPDAVPEPIGRI
jgi:high-affinity iron transporter